MTIPNPLVITFNAVAKTLPRINQDGYGSEYFIEEPTQSFRIRIRHSRSTSKTSLAASIQRHNVEFVHTVLGTGGAPDSVRKTYVVIEHDNSGSAVDLGYLQTALNTLLTSTFVSDLRGWQN